MPWVSYHINMSAVKIFRPAGFIHAPDFMLHVFHKELETVFNKILDKIKAHFKRNGWRPFFIPVDPFDVLKLTMMAQGMGIPPQSPYYIHCRLINLVKCVKFLPVGNDFKAEYVCFHPCHPKIRN